MDTLIYDDRVVARIERTRAGAAAALVDPLRELDPGLRSTAFDVGDGTAVLFGPGMYVNRAIAVGLTNELPDAALDVLEEQAALRDVPAQVEISPWAHPSVLQATARRGYDARWFESTLCCQLAQWDAPRDKMRVAVEVVDGDAALGVWQETSADGFGNLTSERRQISDLYAVALYRTASSSLFVARIGEQAVGTASLTIRDGVAILGAMSTVPTARRQGVQAALVRLRLDRAAAAGCDLAISTAAPGSSSERNLIRGGLSVVYTTVGVQQRKAT